MDFAARGTHTPQSWMGWDGRNVDVLDEEAETGIRVSTTSARSYRDKTDLLIDATVRRPQKVVEPASSLEIVDVDIEPCGTRYLLDVNGRVYRQVPGEGHLSPLGAVDLTDGEVVAIAMTADTLYVATVDTGTVRAYSRELGQLRWVKERGIHKPVGFVRDGDEVFLLDAGPHHGRGTLARVTRDARFRTIVIGLTDPIDADFDDAGDLYVLEPRLQPDSDETTEYVVRRIDGRALARPPVPATESIWVPPRALRSLETDSSFVPGCLATGAPGELLVGVDPTHDGERRLLSYRPERVGFDVQARFRAGCNRMVSVGTGDNRQVFVVNADGSLFRVDASRSYRADPTTGEVHGVVRTAFDAGMDDLQWHRLTLETTVPADTQVQVHYRATNTQPRDVQIEATDRGELRAVDGIGPRKARRLRQAGVEDLVDFLELSPETIATILSVEEVGVARSRVETWREEAASMDEGDLQAITGIGPIRKARLAAGGITSPQELAGLDVGLIASLVTRGIRTITPARAADWQDEAEGILASDPVRATFGTGEDWTTLSAADPRDVLLDANGRYLWVQLDLVGTEDAVPTVQSVDASYPRESYLSELPAVYREDEETSAFLERFLALFERILTDVDHEIADISTILDPQGIPGNMPHLAWLGEFLGVEVDEAWPTEATRSLIEQAPALYRKRGTREGLEEMIQLYLETVDVDRPDWNPALAREHHQLDRLVERGHLTPTARTEAIERHKELSDTSSESLVWIVERRELDAIDADAHAELFERLISCPMGFLVLCHPDLPEEQFRAIGRIVRFQRPAHASGRAVALRQRTVLPGEEGGRGFHTYLGVNTVLPSRELVLEEATLGQESVLGSREPDANLGVHARLDEEARLS